MQNQNHGMIKYTSRDYESIMNEFFELVPKLTDLWKPEAESDPGVVLGKYLASIADMLNVNIDWLANEIFAPSVTQRKNAEKLFGLIGYSLGWYTAAKTEVTFTNNGDTAFTLDFGFNGANFSTLSAYADITGQHRVITYNILPLTSGYGGTSQSRSSRVTTADSVNVFSDMDRVTLQPGDSVTKIAVEGELRYFSVTVETVKKNNYIIKLPSQHVDTTAVWVRTKSSLSQDDVNTQWVQVDSPADFIEPEPRFAVTYDNYSNAQIQISNYLNQLDGYDNNILMIYWIECSGLIGSVNQNVLTNFSPAITELSSGVKVNDLDSISGNLMISNLSNTVELPHTCTVTGKSPETGRQAYLNSRNYINTWDSLITLPDFNRFLNREPGVDCGLVIDCQKALEINLAIYKDSTLTDEQKAKMYISSSDFPVSDSDNFDWRAILGDTVSGNIPFTTNFQTYVAVCYAVHNDFKNSSYGAANAKDPSVIEGNTPTMRSRGISYLQYQPPLSFMDSVLADFRPLQAMTVELQFGYARIFPWYVVGQIYPKNPLKPEDAENLVAIVKEALALYFAPANRQFGQKPTIMEIVEVVQNADPRVRYFDAGSLTNSLINWGRKIESRNSTYIQTYDIECFNPISFAMYSDPGDNNIRVAPEYILK